MNIEARERLAALVKQARGTMTKSAFAEMLGVSHTAVGSWEKGDFMPDVRSLAKISDILGFSIEELLARIEGKKPQAPSKLGHLKQEVKNLRVNEFVELYRSMSERIAELAIALFSFGGLAIGDRTLSVVCISNTVMYTNHFIGDMSKCQHIPKVTRCNVDLSLCI